METRDHILNSDSKVLVSGAAGMVGSGVVRALQRRGIGEILAPSRSEMDISNEAMTRDYLKHHKPDWVVIASALVGGIGDNAARPADYLTENLAIALSGIRQAYLAGVQHLLYLGSICIYPQLAPTPIKEESLMTGLLEPTNDGYAYAKIAGIMLCDSYNRQYGTDYRNLMPTNLYGFNDNFRPEQSHVLPALLLRIHQTMERGDKVMELWGDGSPQREFLHVDDLASACCTMMETSKEAWLKATDNGAIKTLNAGTSTPISIRDLADTIADVTGFEGTFSFNTSKPNGAPLRGMDCSRLYSLGWQPEVDLRDGIAQTWEWFQKALKDGSLRV